MAVISFSGLATGLDTSSIIDQLTQVRRRPLELEIARQNDRQDTRAAFSTFESKLSAVKTALANLRTADDVLVKAAESSDETVVKATAGVGAKDGLTTVTVSQLATASRATAGTGVSDTTSTIAAGAGTLEFTVGGGSTETVSFTASTTLQELVDSINNLGAGVTASAVNVGTVASASYKLQIVSNEPGSSSDIAITNDNTSLLITATAANDSQFTVTGFSETIERASNTISDVIPGVTLELVKSGSSAQVTVSNDGTSIEEEIQGFVDAFNDLIAFVDQNSDVTPIDDSTSDVGVFVANPTIRGVIDQLREDIRTSISGTSGGVTTLSQIGIATQSDGTLAFSSSTFQEELAENPQGVGELLGGVGTDDGVADLLHSTITTLTEAGGLLFNVQQDLDEDIRRADESIEAGERAVEAFRGELEVTFALLESTVNTIQSQGDFLLSQLSAVRGSAPKASK